MEPHVYSISWTLLVSSKITFFSIYLTFLGQEEYSFLMDQYVKNGEGFVLVYSVTDVSSFEAIHELRTQLLRNKQNIESLPVVLAGNKSDLNESRVILTEEGKKLCDSWGGRERNAVFLETSAKINRNVMECFFEIVRLINHSRMYNTDHFGEKGKSLRSGKCALL